MLLTTHYMDEVEALADRVAVLFGQEIVARGTPTSIGGRDVGAVTIRFRLPEGVSLTDLPVAGARPAPDGHVEIRTEDELRLLHALTGWALDSGTRSPGCRCCGCSLEDVYLSLTRGTGSAPEDEAPRGAGGAGASAGRLEAGDEHRQPTGDGPLRGDRGSAPGGPPGLLRATDVLAQPDRRILDHRVFGGVHRDLREDLAASRRSTTWPTSTSGSTIPRPSPPTA